MIRIVLPLLCAALGFATASCSQSGGPFAPTTDNSGSGAAPSGTDAQSAAGSSATIPESGSSQPAVLPPAARRASVLIGMPVVSSDSAPLGAIKDIIFDPQGQATDVVITRRADSQAGDGGSGASSAASGGSLIAIPWNLAISHLKSGQVVLDAKKLAGAPAFAPDDWPDLARPGWSTAAHAYWRSVTAAATAPTRARGSIDSTSRQRASRTRGDN